MTLLNKKTAIFKYLSSLAAILIVVFLLWPKNSFDESLLSTKNIYSHIEELSSETYQGRLAGSEGDKKAREYIESYFREIGVEPAGVNETYLQPFSTIIPDIDAEPIFTIRSKDGNIIQSLSMYEDYNALTFMNGGSIDFSGEIVFLGSDLLRTEPEFIKDRVVIIEANRLTPKHVNYVMQAGGKGVICSAGISVYDRNERYELEKALSINGKTGKSIFAGYISYDAHRDLLAIADDDMIKGEGKSFEIVSGARIKIEIGFPVVETANILGKIQGTSSDGKVLLIAANIDGTGEGTEGKYFPGAFTNASGIAALLEAANVIVSQSSRPYDTIVFAGWNGEQQQLSGSSYYINNPLHPLADTTVVYLGGIGKETIEGLKVSSDMFNGTILKDRILNYAKDSRLKVTEGAPAYGFINQFNNKKVPAVVLSDSSDVQNNYNDTIDKIDKESLENSAKVLLTFIKRDIYKDRGLDFLTLSEKALIGIIALGAVSSYIIVTAYNKNPNKKVMGHSIESIYFSGSIILLRKIFTITVSCFIAIFMLALLANIDPGTDIRMVGNEISTNFSGYLTIKKSILYIRTMLNPSSYKVHAAGNILKIIYNSSRLSLLLILAALILSTVIGILRGMYEGYRSKKARMSSIGTLVFFSIPDVLIVLLTLFGYVLVARKLPMIKETAYIKGFILPLFTLTIIPAVYISRITFVTIQEEQGKDYIKNAIAKGFSRKKAIFYELIPAVVFKIVDTMPAIMTTILTNMIVVEWLFNYHGILYYLLYFYKRQDVYSFVPLALTLGLMYVVFTWGIQFLARIINPLKSKGVRR
jgi:ABC-type dipeptide/oligopeptide/nickel transport system permease component